MVADLAAGLRSAQARIDLDRLAANFRSVAAASVVPLMPVVKADAYGHGAVSVSRALVDLGAPLLAVAYVEEGLHLRDAGIEAPIVVLAGFETSQIRSLWDARLTPVVSTERMAKDVAAHASERSALAVHVKVDTGMTRLGLPSRDILRTARALARTPGVVLEGLMTHLLAPGEDAAATRRQLDVFDDVVADLREHDIQPQWIHAASSAAIPDLRPTHTLARPGLLLYGARPASMAREISVSPVMTVAARILMMRDVDAGATVSYGARFQATRPSRIATVPLGYADGVPRTEAMSREGFFHARGRRAPIAGTVCMDMTMLDVTEIDGVAEGDEVVLFGDAPTAWEIASWAGTTVWEALTSVGCRLPRVFTRGGVPCAVESRYPQARGS